MGHATTPIAAALAAAIRRHARLLRRRVPAAIAGDPRAVHRARVASRRLREALGMAAAAAPRGGVSRLLRAVRRVTRALGPVRELDVARDELARAAGRHAWPPAAVHAIDAALARTRDRRASRTAAARRDLPDGRAMTLAVRSLATVDETRWFDALTRRVLRRASRVINAAAACGTLYAPDRLHALRIAVKKLRYALELVPPTVDAGLAPLVRTLRTAQQRLGHLHDLDVLTGEVRALDARAAGNGRTFAPVLDGLERDCREAHAAALALAPAVVDAARETIARMKLWRQDRRRPAARARLGASAGGPKQAAGPGRAARAGS